MSFTAQYTVTISKTLKSWKVSWPFDEVCWENFDTVCISWEPKLKCLCFFFFFPLQMISLATIWMKGRILEMSTGISDFLLFVCVPLFHFNERVHPSRQSARVCVKPDDPCSIRSTCMSSGHALMVGKRTYNDHKFDYVWIVL